MPLKRITYILPTTSKISKLFLSLFDDFEYLGNWKLRILLFSFQKFENFIWKLTLYCWLLSQTFGVLMVTQDNPTSDSWVVPINDPLIFDNPQRLTGGFCPTVYNLQSSFIINIYRPRTIL